MCKLELGQIYDPQKHHIGQYAVQTALDNMKLEKTKVKKMCQQSNNNVVWVKARYQLASQLLVQFGEELLAHVHQEILPNEFINSTIDSSFGLSLYQIAWCNEIHICHKIGKILDYIYFHVMKKEFIITNLRLHQKNW